MSSSLKQAPKYDGVSQLYVDWKRDIEIWRIATNVEIERQGPVIMLSLSGAAKDAVRHLTLDKIKGAGGVSVILDELKIFQQVDVVQADTYQTEFDTFIRPSDMRFTQYVGEFQSKLSRLESTGLSAPEGTKLNWLISKSNLTEAQRVSIQAARATPVNNNMIFVSGLLKTFDLGAGSKQDVTEVYVVRKNERFARKTCDHTKHKGGAEKCWILHPEMKPKRIKCNKCKRWHYKNEPCKMNETVEDANKRPPANYVNCNQNAETNDVYTCVAECKHNCNGPSIRCIVDTGAASTVVGDDTLMERIKVFGPEAAGYTVEPSSKVYVFGGENKQSSFQTKIVPIFLKDMRLHVKTDIVAGKTPFLLSMQSLRKLGAKIDVSRCQVEMLQKQYPISIINGVCVLEEKKDVEINNAENVKKLEKSDVEKLHLQTNHISKETLKKALEIAYGDPHETIVDEVIKICPNCSLQHHPAKPPKASLTPIRNFNDVVEMDLTYYKEYTILHMVDLGTGLNAAILIANRSHPLVWTAFLRIWIFSYGPPCNLRVDKEFAETKSHIAGRCKRWNISVSSVATEAWWQIGVVERYHQELKKYIEKLEAQYGDNVSMSFIVPHAAMMVNQQAGSNGKLSPFERVFRVSNNILGSQQQVVSEYDVENDKRKRVAAKIQSLLRGNQKNIVNVQVGSVVDYHRNKFGWIGPAHVTKINGKVVLVSYNGKEYTSSLEKIRLHQQPLQESMLDDTSSEEENTTKDSEIVQNPQEIHPDTNIHSENQDEPPMETVPPQPSKEILPLRKSRRIAGLEPIFHAELEDPISTIEKEEAYEREKASWILTKCFQSVKRDNVEPPNLIRSFVLYRRKPGGMVKARIVPMGNLDQQKEALRTDSPTLSYQCIRLLLSLCVEKGWKVKTCDVKTAFLQTDENNLEREIYIIPPKEDNTYATHIWKLKKTVYGLVDGPRIWYEKLSTVLQQRYNVLATEPSIYYLKEENKLVLVIGVQIDDFIYGGEPKYTNDFYEYVSTQFDVSIERSDDIIYSGLRIRQQGDALELKSTTMMGIAKIDANHQDFVTDEDITKYRSLVGKILYCGSTISPFASYISSYLAQKISSLEKHHMKESFFLLKKLKSFSNTIRFRTFEQGLDGVKIRIYSDASFGMSASQGSYIIFLEQSNIVHPLAWKSYKHQRVVLSTFGSELIAACIAVDMGMYLRDVIVDLTGKKLETLLITDNKSLLDASTTLHQPEEKRLLRYVEYLRQAYDEDMINIIWTTSKLNLADSLTKKNYEAASLLDKVLATGEIS
jgi:NACalpha-BTF3-like transcription factor